MVGVEEVVGRWGRGGGWWRGGDGRESGVESENGWVEVVYDPDRMLVEHRQGGGRGTERSVGM